MTRRSLCAALLALGAATAAAQDERPRLVLAISVDQLRGDALPRMESRFGPGGFRRLMERGVHYLDAHYEHAVTETAVGHATLFTGAHPARHGIVGNGWLDPATGRDVYNCEDPAHPIVGRPEDARGGRSPALLRAPTIGDSLALATAGRAKVFGLSLKDRSAILPAGFAGTAYWASRETGGFVTSTYYAEELPAWLQEWNATAPQRFSGAEWTLAAAPESYVAPDERPYEPNVAAMGRAFPHALGEAGTRLYVPRLLVTPFGDALLADLTKVLIEVEQLGVDEVPDLLAVGFSSTDAIGHAYGPASREAEDNLLQLDRTLAELLDFVDERVGLEHTLVILSADHGIAESPARAAEARLPARLMARKDVLTGEARARLSARFETGEDLILDYAPPYVYLDLAKLAELELDRAEVERALAQELRQVPGVAGAYSVTDALTGLYGDELLAARVRNSAFEGRSGHVHVVADPYCLVFDPMAGPFASHGSPWRYDTHVPVLLAGWRLTARQVARPVGVHQLAPTVAALLRIEAPAAASDALLFEVIEGD